MNKVYVTKRRDRKGMHETQPHWLKSSPGCKNRFTTGNKVHGSKDSQQANTRERRRREMFRTIGVKAQQACRESKRKESAAASCEADPGTLSPWDEKLSL